MGWAFAAGRGVVGRKTFEQSHELSNLGVLHVYGNYIIVLKCCLKNHDGCVKNTSWDKPPSISSPECISLEYDIGTHVQPTHSLQHPNAMVCSSSAPYRECWHVRHILTDQA